MSLNILDFRINVIAELPNTKDIFVERLILDAIQELCRETSCFIEEVTGMLSIKDTASYAVTITTSNAEMIGMWQAKYNNKTLDPITDRDMDHRDSEWEQRSGTPDGAIYDGDINIRFNVTPDTSGKAISVEALIMPNSVDGVVPPRIEKRHREAVKSYVKWKVYESPKHFNGELALYFRNDYTRRKNVLKIEIAQGGDVIEARPRSFVTGQARSPRFVVVNA
jgi:hypothetical protein